MVLLNNESYSSRKNRKCKLCGSSQTVYRRKKSTIFIGDMTIENSSFRCLKCGKEFNSEILSR